jgi:hydroxymethylglutaryl-CoA reductase
MTMAGRSRISGFYRLPVEARRDELRAQMDLSFDDLHNLDRGGLDVDAADRMVENAVGLYALPLGLGLNFQVNNVDYLVPMAVEEPSVVAAASNAARLVRLGGGFEADADPSIMTAQVELLRIEHPALARGRIEAHTAEILALANQAVPKLVARGGGARGLTVRTFEDAPADSPELAGRVVVHLHIDCCDAMGANLVNTVAEAVADNLVDIAGGEMGLRILTNLADRRLVRVTGRVPFSALGTTGATGATGDNGAQVAADIVAASRFAEQDPYRAATHNKGIMNGVDAVAIATGNDWRGVEAGAHAYAAITGRYRPLATWALDKDDKDNDKECLTGRLVMPMAVGTAGGTLPVHPGARLGLKILGVTSARTLAMIMGSVGMASNLAALRALVTEGIQRGHMALHRKAVAAGPSSAASDAARVSPSDMVP